MVRLTRSRSPGCCGAREAPILDLGNGASARPRWWRRRRSRRERRVPGRTDRSRSADRAKRSASDRRRAHLCPRIVGRSTRPAAGIPWRAPREQTVRQSSEQLGELLLRPGRSGAVRRPLQTFMTLREADRWALPFGPLRADLVGEPFDHEPRPGSHRAIGRPRIRVPSELSVTSSASGSPPIVIRSTVASASSRSRVAASVTASRTSSIWSMGMSSRAATPATTLRNICTDRRRGNLGEDDGREWYSGDLYYR